MAQIFTNLSENTMYKYSVTICLHAELNYFKVCLPNLHIGAIALTQNPF